jgi:hypothetical protein
VHFTIGATWDGTPVAPEEQIQLEAWLDESGLHLRVDAPYYRDPPPLGPVGPTPGLWDYEVVEFFLLGADGQRYTEIEVSPHGHHLVLCLSGVRTPSAVGLPLDYVAAIEGDRWVGRATLAPEHLPEGPYRANACAIHGSGRERRYLSAALLAGEQPDFHRLEAFPRADLGRD